MIKRFRGGVPGPPVSGWLEPESGFKAFRIRALDQDLMLSEPTDAEGVGAGFIKSGDILSTEIGEGCHIGANFQAYFGIGGTDDWAGDVTVAPGSIIGDNVSITTKGANVGSLPDNYTG